MAISISLPADFLEGKPQPRAEEDRPNYISSKFQAASAYFRIENWYPDISEHTFPTKFVSIDREQAVMITRFYQELRLRAGLRDQERTERGEPVPAWRQSVHDVDFREEFYQFAMATWPESWRVHLDKLRSDLDAVISQCENGAFVKLSNRSPKDSALYTPVMRDYVKREVEKSTLDPASSEAINEDLSICNMGAWIANKCMNADDAMKLLLMSERINLDIHAHMLVEEEFNLNVVVRDWCNELDPSWEFRAFVVNSKLNACTVYSSFTYVPAIAEHAAEIERMIVEFWESCKDQIREEGYTIDFFVTPDLSAVKIIEINALPPIAGTSLFDWHNEEDRKIILQGPFTFRVQMEPLQARTQVTKSEKDGHQVTVVRSLPPTLDHMFKVYRGLVNEEEELAAARAQAEAQAEAAAAAESRSSSGWCVVS